MKIIRRFQNRNKITRTYGVDNVFYEYKGRKLIGTYAESYSLTDNGLILRTTTKIA